MIRSGIRTAVHALALTFTLSVCGQAGNRAFIWDAVGGMRDVAVHSNPYSDEAYSYAEGLNNLGVVVGWGDGSWSWNSVSGEKNYIPFTFPADINDLGEVVGTEWNSYRGWVGYLSGSTGLLDIGKLPGDAWASPGAINNKGQVVGYSGDGTHSRPFIWDRINGMKLLPIPDGFVSGIACGINDQGLVVGRIGRADSTEVAVYWNSPTEAHIIGSTEPGYASCAYDVNNSGQIVGGMKTQDGNWRAFVWDSTKGMKDIGVLPGQPDSCAVAINDNGQVVGQSDEKGFIWDSANGMRDLGSLGVGGCYPADINNSGLVCGYSEWRRYKKCSISQAKREPYQTLVEIADVVVVGEILHRGTLVESVDRCSGMLIRDGGPWPVGTRLSIRGVMCGIEIRLEESPTAVQGEPLEPLGVTSSSLRPQLSGPEFEWGQWRLDMTGILVRLAGKVTAVDTEKRVAYVDDGGAFKLYGAPKRGIKVYIPEEVDLPAVQSSVVITGVGLREESSLGEETRIGEHIWPMGTFTNATSIVCREASDIRALDSAK